jgi:hypothetical protein
MRTTKVYVSEALLGHYILSPGCSVFFDVWLLASLAAAMYIFFSVQFNLNDKVFLIPRIIFASIQAFSREALWLPRTAVNLFCLHPPVGHIFFH